MQLDLVAWYTVQALEEFSRQVFTGHGSNGLLVINVEENVFKTHLANRFRKALKSAIRNCSSIQLSLKLGRENVYTAYPAWSKLARALPLVDIYTLHSF